MRIETTHVGSLPRGPELVPLLLARDHGEPYDAAEFDRLVQAAVSAAIDQQIAAGVSIVSDGELGKVGYSTYMTERLSGFGGDVPRKPALDLAPLPEFRKKLGAIMGDQEFVRAACIGPVKLVDLQPACDDIRRFRAALGGKGVKGFMN
ncbi:MAG TPA: epoxyalkane--coenzyme M transferase, partial [Novosphingobium sp.]